LKGVVQMQDKYHALRSVLIAALLPAIFAGKMGSAEPALTEQILEAIQNCMAQSPAPWPDEWKQEYLDTIRRAVESHQDAPHYAVRLEILRKGFAPCWHGLTKNKDRPLFEVYLCRTRWYVEHLMGTKFPSEEERQRLRNQFTEIWNHAANSLLEQFPFLDPNAVQAAKADDLSLCYRKIELPLMPVYLHPLSAEQVAQIKQRLDKLRYARVDLWRQLISRSPTPGEPCGKSCTSLFFGLVYFKHHDVSVIGFADRSIADSKTVQIQSCPIPPFLEVFVGEYLHSLTGPASLGTCARNIDSIIINKCAGKDISLCKRQRRIASTQINQTEVILTEFIDRVAFANPFTTIDFSLEHNWCRLYHVAVDRS